jgi:NAD(P)-dependent dehydrogenase (short-subunit alcohol dehydrogenase family)
MRSVLITGATSGIGEQLAMDYANQGWHVWACGRNQQKLQQLSDYNEHISTLAFDITDLEQCQQQLANLDPLPSLWILNAGDCEYINNGIVDAKLVRRVFEINVIGLANVIDAIQGHFKAGQHLAIVGSIASEFPLTRAEAYGGSKAAVSYFSRTLAVDLVAKGIKVTTVYPGFVKTPLTDKNDFDMPMRVSVVEASLRIRQGLAKNQTSIYFPRRFTWILRLLGALPYSIQHKLAQKLVKDN